MMRYSLKTKYFLYVLAIIITYSCNTNTSLTDSQGNEYQAKKIGKQIWLTENLKLVLNENTYCYNDLASECDTMGRLYTWEAAIKLAAMTPGWHLPTKEEWDELIDYCGNDSIAYKNIISDKLGFDPQWAGIRTSKGRFIAKNFNGVNYWSSTTADTSAILAYSVAIMSNIKKISPHNYPKENACSVRLVKD